ncbi:MAG: hypothetical protein K0R57_4688 [Paenibacillaceae bacterium]|jgi:AraC-like DNA-binding protein|nr:hypothetical protein [Paenibacillaceae bacterium]
MGKHWLNRLLLSYLPIFTVITLVLLTITALSISEMSRKAAENANNVSVSHAMSFLDNSLKFIDDTMLKEIQANNVLKQYYYPPADSNSYHSVYEPSVLLRSLMSVIQTIRIDSIYLYRAADQAVLTANSLLTLDTFGDREFVEGVLAAYPAEVWSNARSYKEFVSQERGISVVSLVRKVPALSGGQGFVVVNIRTSDIAQLIGNMMDSGYSQVSLRDRKGISLKDNLLPAAAAPNGEAEKADSPDSSVSAVQSDYTGWHMQSRLHSMGAFMVITGYTKILLMIGVAVILVGTIAIVIVSRRNYRPIESILSRLKAVSSTGKKENGAVLPGRNEFQFIEAALDNMMEQSSQYEARQKEDHLFRRRYFFQELMNGRQIMPRDWREEFSRLGLEPSFSRLQVAVVELDRYRQFCRSYSHTDQSLLKYVISNVVSEITAHEKRQVWSEWLDGNRLAVLYRWTGEPEGEDAVPASAVRLCGWIADNLKFTVTVGAGPQVAAMEQIGESYQGALEAVKYKTVVGTGTVITYEEISKSESGETYGYLQQIRKLALAYRLGEDGWKQQFQEIASGLRGMLFSRDDLVSLANYLIYHLQREMMELPEELRESWRTMAYEQLNAVVDQFETAGELFLQLEDVLAGAAERIREERESRTYHAVIQRVKAYIEHNYANPDLSLNYLSDIFGVNAKHVSQLFKEEFGVKFSDYVIQVRVENAKRLLLESGQPVQEVAAKVGYLLPFSFIRVFKKVVGVTPGDYRKECG